MNDFPPYKNWQKNKILQSKQHQYKAAEEINNLVVKSRSGKNILLSDGSWLTEFVSCSYLGLDQDKRVIKASMNSLESCGVNFAVSRTRMRTESFVILEELLNQIFCKSYTTLFTSLHLGHVGVLPLLSSGEMPSFPISNSPLFILDKSVHASIQLTRGILNQFGEIKIVDFNSHLILEEEFKNASQRRLTPIGITDGIGSMGGMCEVEELFRLAEMYGGYIYIDDAHGTSVYGVNGCGWVLEKLNHSFHPRLILAASLSKGFGTNGGVISVPTKKDDDFIKRFASPYIFSNPPPLSIVDASIASAQIHLSTELNELRDKLRARIAFFDSKMEVEGLADLVNYNTQTPIRCHYVGDEFEAINIASELKKRGLMVSAAMYPTVAKSKSLLRITISANHSKDSIVKLCKSLKILFNDFSNKIY